MQVIGFIGMQTGPLERRLLINAAVHAGMTRGLALSVWLVLTSLKEIDGTNEEVFPSEQQHNYV